MESWESHVTQKTRGANEPKESTSCMFVHKVLFEFLEFKHPRLLLVSPSDTSTGGGLLGVKFLASENWCGRVHFGGHSPEWRVLAKFSVQHCSSYKQAVLQVVFLTCSSESSALDN